MYYIHCFQDFETWNQSAVQKTQEGTWDSEEWKNEIVVSRVEKKYCVLQVLGVSCVPAHSARCELNVCEGCGLAHLLHPDSSCVPGEREWNQKKSFFLKPVLLYGLIWLLAVSLLLQGGQCEDGVGGWHRGGRRWRWGRGGGRRGLQLLRSFINFSRGGGGASTVASQAGGGGGSSVTPGSSSGRRCFPPGILFGLLPHQLPLMSAPLPPQVSVTGGGGRGGWGRLVLLGFPAGVSEAGERGTKPHPAPGRALYSLL